MARIDWDIIERKLEGGLTPGEEEAFGEWYAEKDEHRAYFRKVERFEREDRFGREVPDERVDESWRRFKARHVAPRRRRLWYLGGAAAACLLAAVVALRFLGGGEASPAVELAGTEARGGLPTLTLSSGERVELAEQREIEERSSTITNTGKELNYSTKADSVTVNTALRNKLETPIGGEYRIKLEDGTVAYIGAKSSLDFPVVFPEDERVVKVSGEVYFEVRHEEGRPFIVELSDDTRVEVLGTVFNVRDYADEDFVETTLISGRVRMTAGGESQVLEPSRQARLDKTTRELSCREVDVNEYVDWKDGRINVRNQRLEDILTRLSKWYDIHVFFLDERAKDVRFYANMNRYHDVEELLDKFEQTGEVRFFMKGNVLQVQSAD